MKVTAERSIYPIAPVNAGAADFTGLSSQKPCPKNRRPAQFSVEILYNIWYNLYIIRLNVG
jgi:hypothetical protein